jgi:tol-pal system protein YbgF
VIVPASAAGTADKEHDQILAELRQLQLQLSVLQTNQGRLEQALQRVSNLLIEQDSSIRRTLVDTGTTLDTVQENLLILSERLDETNGRIGNLRREVASLRPTQPIVIPETPEGGESAPPGGGPPSSPGGQPPDSAPPGPAAGPPGASADLYQQAYTDYTQGRYPLAISGFKELIASDPNSDLADNAQYWIGECLLAQRQYTEALEAFDAVLSLYPNSNKLPEATYKKAVALEALGSRADAVAQLELVIETYPRTPAARAARGMLRSLRQ